MSIVGDVSISRGDIRRYYHRLLEAQGDESHALIHFNRDLADHAVAGEINFNHLGNRYVHVGRAAIDWSAPQHQHQEWPAQLNRFFQLPSLAAAYAQTGEEQYAEAARDYIADWIRAHPSREDWTLAKYDNTLNLSIRMQQWTISIPRFLDSPAFDDAFLMRIIESISTQLDYLIDHLTILGNWRIAQADALMAVSLLLPFLSSAAKWQDVAVRVINDAYHRQVLPDGAHIERNPSYHQWMTRVFERYWRLGKAFPELGLQVQPEVIARMYDYAIACMRPNGSINELHDCHGYRTGSHRNLIRDNRAHFLNEAELPDALPPTSQFFPATGQACLRDGWGEDATYLTFDATTWGGGHCHLSRNAIQIHAYGRSLLVDPASLTYETSDPMMAHCKSTRAHNTLNFNGWNQTFTDPAYMKYASLPGYDLVHSLYTGGYWPGEYQWHFPKGRGPGLYAEHHRTMLWLHGRCIIIIDHAVRDASELFAPAPIPPPSIEINWQLCDGPIEVDAEQRRVVTKNDDANLLMLFPQVVDGMTLSVHEGETDPPRGWLSGDKAYIPAPQISLHCPSMAGYYANVTTVLVPFAGTRVPTVTAGATPPNDRDAQTLLLRWEDGSTDELVFSSRLHKAIEDYNGLVTDAAMVHLHKDSAGNLVEGLVVDGTYCSPFTTEVRQQQETFRL